MHCLCFICGLKFYASARTRTKITRQWKSTLIAVSYAFRVTSTHFIKEFYNTSKSTCIYIYIYLKLNFTLNTEHRIGDLRIGISANIRWLYFNIVLPHRLSQSRSLGFLVWCGRTRHERLLSLAARQIYRRNFPPVMLSNQKQPYQTARQSNRSCEQDLET